MLDAEYIAELSQVVKGEKDCSQRVYNLLKRNNCLYIIECCGGHSHEGKSIVMMNKVVQNYRYSCCKKLFEELQNIPYAILKGAVLSKMIYGEPYYRISGDIDLLVSPKNVDKVTKILNDNGFVQGKIKDNKIEKSTREEILYYKLYTHQLASFEKQTNHFLSPTINIDVNFDLLWGECSQKINIDEVLRQIEPCTIFDVNVNRLSDIYEFIALCLHHYKDMNSIYLLEKNGLMLNEFFDIYYYLVNRKLNPDELMERTQYHNVREYVYYCIYFTYELVKDHRLKKYLETLYTPEAHELLEYYGLCNLERKKWGIPFYERLFDVNFKARFRANLSEEERYKVELNRKFM